eukprot:1769731-Rhodomonas_salina.1
MQLLTPLPPLIPSSLIRQNITQKLQEQANLLPESYGIARRAGDLGCEHSLHILKQRQINMEEAAVFVACT